MRGCIGTYFKSRGFTLIELLVSMILFAVIMLFGMVFFSFSSNSFSDSKETTFAISCANNEMERMKTVDWVDVTAGSNLVTDTQTGIVYTVLRAVNLHSSGGTNYLTITISVTWPGQKAPVEIESLRAEN